MSLIKITKITFLTIFLALLYSVQKLQAQNEEGKSGTVYSSYGIGMPLQLNTAQEKAMGISGVSFNDISSPGLSNPAFWGMGSYTRISANFDYTNYSIEDAQNKGKNSLLQVSNFQALFPLIKNKLGLSLALYPETRTSYNVNSVRNISVGGSDLEYFSNRTGSGGITKFEIGLGYKLLKNLSVGYAPSYSFLTEKEEKNTQFFDPNFNANTEQQNVSGTSISHRFGALLNFSRILLPSDKLQVGLSFYLPTNYEASRISETIKNIDGINETIIVGQKEEAIISTPVKYGGGLTYYSSPKFNISAEFMAENWEDADYGFSNVEEGYLKNRAIYGLGTQFHPYKSRSTNFLSRFKYSLGLSYDTGHLRIQNEDISTLWFSAGVGLVSPNVLSASSFDLSLQYGIRGTTNQNLVKESIFGINLSINLTELMFLQRKLN